MGTTLGVTGAVGDAVGAASAVELQLRMADALTDEPEKASDATNAGSPPSQHTNVSVDMPPKAYDPMDETLAGMRTLESFVP